MEVLIGLTILGVTLLLFWQSYNNQIQINEKLTNSYAIDRLEYDVKILNENRISMKIAEAFKLVLSLKLSPKARRNEVCKANW